MSLIDMAPSRAAMRGRGLSALVAGALLASAMMLEAQTTRATTTLQRRARCADCPPGTHDSVRARNNRLLLRFDSLRREFENERSESEREHLSREMHRVVMAIQESFQQEARAEALTAARTNAQFEREFRMAPYMKGEIQNLYRTSGYLGVSFDGPNVDVMRNNERIIRFFAYPRIELVEPSSPAEEAGILAGDTLLEFNGMDVRDREISLTKLLVPKNVIRMRVRRDGERRDFSVIVAKAPEYVISRAVRQRVAPPVPGVSPAAPIPPGAVAAPGPVVAPGQVRVYAEGELPRRRPMPGAAGVGTIWIYNDGIFGAQVESVSEGLGRALGVKSGVLVITARPGTPAYRSGLRDGDVIRRVSGKSVESVRELRVLLTEMDGEDGVRLSIVRERKNRELTLRW